MQTVGLNMHMDSEHDWDIVEAWQKHPDKVKSVLAKLLSS